jgi:MoxR-like ATPase
LRLLRPLFLEGEAGVGKTEVARTLAAVLDAPLIRLQCYEGIDASQALYDWDFPRQLLHLRALETASRAGRAVETASRAGRAVETAASAGLAAETAASAGGVDAEAVEHELYDRRFLVARPLLAALETTPSVLLVDEVDRADDEFEAFLLEVLSDFTVSVPELGTIRAETPPVVVITSNRTREVHDALKRRCYYHWLDHPGFDREVAIVRTRLPQAGERLAREVTAAVQALRRGGELLKPPGVAETLDWTEALIALGVEHLDPETATATLGAVLKYREDQERARALDFGNVLEGVLRGV